jgi:hypothetical protein
MKQSLTGVVDRISRILEREGDPNAYVHVLRTLITNLREVKKRHENGESAQVLDDFFSVYVMED